MKELFITNVGSHLWKMDSPQSDIDLFVVNLASTKAVMSQEFDPKSEITGFPGEPGKVDRQSHELGKVIEQLGKNNWNFLIGVMSPLVFKDWERLSELRKLTRLNLSKLAYNSIHGLAVHNYNKYVVNERDDSPKRCALIGRTILMGSTLLRKGEFEFEPIEGVTPKDIPKFIAELDEALKESKLPDKPEHTKELRDFLYEVRFQSLLDEDLRLADWRSL